MKLPYRCISITRCLRILVGLTTEIFNPLIIDQGWSEFRRQLRYKLDWNGWQLIATTPQNTSRTCPKCGHAAAGNRISQACFLCVLCGHAGNADLVAAINIQRAVNAT